MSTVYVWDQLGVESKDKLRTLFVAMSWALAACWIESEGEEPTSVREHGMLALCVRAAHPTGGYFVRR
jgi:hypothetical protein